MKLLLGLVGLSRLCLVVVLLGCATAAPAPTATPSVTAETVAPSATAAGPRPLPSGGPLEAGTYNLHPLPEPNDSVTVTLTVGEGWAAFGTVLLPSGEPDVGPPGGMAILFPGDVTTLNDPCNWRGTDDDVAFGPEVDDLVEALLAQTEYEVSDPVDVTVGGHSGKRVDILVPTEPFPGENSDAPDCDQDNYLLWNSTAWGDDGIYAQGPADRWHTNILDVDGTRLVIVTRDFAGTSAEDRAEMDAIISSLVISP